VVRLCMFPQFNNLFPSLSLRANIAIGATLSKPEQENRLHELCKCIPEMCTVLHSLPHAVSGGQRQFAAVFRAFMHSPTLLVLDEPMAGISVERAGPLYGLLMRHLPTESALLYTDHHRSIAQTLAIRSCTLINGKLTWDVA
jgi:ABC-type branched-subunit amino acid transport system ATPase component